MIGLILNADESVETTTSIEFNSQPWRRGENVDNVIARSATDGQRIIICEVVGSVRKCRRRRFRIDADGVVPQAAINRDICVRYDQAEILILDAGDSARPIESKGESASSTGDGSTVTWVNWNACDPSTHSDVIICIRPSHLEFIRPVTSNEMDGSGGTGVDADQVIPTGAMNSSKQVTHECNGKRCCSLPA